MPSYLNISASTKESVLEGFAKYFAGELKAKELTTTELIDNKYESLRKAVVWRRNTFAGPLFVAIGPMRPSREDERLKLYRTRFGMVSND